MLSDDMQYTHIYRLHSCMSCMPFLSWLTHLLPKSALPSCLSILSKPSQSLQHTHMNKYEVNVSPRILYILTCCNFTRSVTDYQYLRVSHSLLVARCCTLPTASCFLLQYLCLFSQKKRIKEKIICVYGGERTALIPSWDHSWSPWMS